MFGETCCTFIPDNTAAEGSLTRAIEGLKTLHSKMKDHSGIDNSFWDDWMNVFGKYKNLVDSVLISVAVFAANLTLCGCCCISVFVLFLTVLSPQRCPLWSSRCRSCTRCSISRTRRTDLITLNGLTCAPIRMMSIILTKATSCTSVCKFFVVINMNSQLKIERSG